MKPERLKEIEQEAHSEVRYNALSIDGLKHVNRELELIDYIRQLMEVNAKMSTTSTNEQSVPQAKPKPCENCTMSHNYRMLNCFDRYGGERCSYMPYDMNLDVDTTTEPEPPLEFEEEYN
jgi:hypothetical protein